MSLLRIGFCYGEKVSTSVLFIISTPIKHTQATFYKGGYVLKFIITYDAKGSWLAEMSGGIGETRNLGCTILRGRQILRAVQVKF